MGFYVIMMAKALLPLITISSGEHPTENIYQIVMEKISDDIAPFDRLVGKTVEHIITGFFLALVKYLMVILELMNSTLHRQQPILNQLINQYFRISIYKIIYRPRVNGF